MGGAIVNDVQASVIEQTHASSTPVYLETKSDLVQYYQMKYPARWQSQLTEDLAPIANAKATSLARRFQPKRIDQASSNAAQEQYRQLGQQIGAVEWIPPENGYEITYVGEIAISEDCYPRSFTIYIDGLEAYAFANSPDIMTALSKYADGKFVPRGWCEEPEIEIQAA